MASEGTPKPRNGHSARRWRPDGHILVVSNRSPVEFKLDETGSPKPGLGRGGVVTALTGVRRFMEVTWVAAALTPGDRRVAAEGRPIEFGEGCQIRFVHLPENQYHLYYNVFSNPILWFLQHGLWDRLERPQLVKEILHAWEQGYRPVNQSFADIVCEELARPDSAGAVLFQDYQLYLAPRRVRECAPNAVLQHFIHIPWPAPEAWLSLPRGAVRAICDSLLANDVIRFQTQESLHNFLLTCYEFLPGSHIDLGGMRARYEGRWTSLRVDPIAPDVVRLRRLAASLEVRAYRRKLAAPEGVATIARVDRLDPAKNALGGFQALELLLEKEPSLQGRLRFLAFLVPTRSAVPEYRRYAGEVFRLIDHINERYGSADWKPVQVFYENNHAQALAGMALSDVLLVNSLADGLNLVSMEGPILNRRHGVLVLSTRAGSYHQLKEGAIPVEPEDIEGTADALYRALTMPLAERRRRARLLKKAATARDLESWLQGQMADLKAVLSESRRRPELVTMADAYRIAISA